MLGASGVMLPAKVPADGADLYDGPIRRAFVDGIVRGLRYVDGRTTSEIGPA